MVKWHSVDEYPRTSQVVVIDSNGKIKIAGVQQGKRAPYDWATIEEVFSEIDCLDYIVEQFSRWETDTGCPDKCVFSNDVFKAILKSGKIQSEDAKKMVENTSLAINGCKCSDFCGMKNRECECWTEQYRKDFDSRN